MESLKVERGLCRFDFLTKMFEREVRSKSSLASYDHRHPIRLKGMGDAPAVCSLRSRSWAAGLPVPARRRLAPRPAAGRGGNGHGVIGLVVLHALVHSP
jgi:hypothetical protein